MRVGKGEGSPSRGLGGGGPEPKFLREAPLADPRAKAKQGEIVLMNSPGDRTPLNEQGGRESALMKEVNERELALMKEGEGREMV